MQDDTHIDILGTLLPYPYDAQLVEAKACQIRSECAKEVNSRYGRPAGSPDLYMSLNPNKMDSEVKKGKWTSVHGDGKATTKGARNPKTMQTTDDKYKLILNLVGQRY